MYVVQEKMRGQRGRLPVQALGYVNFAYVIFGIVENGTSAFPFMSACYHSVSGNLKMVVYKEIRFVDRRVFYGYVRESWYFRMGIISQNRRYIFTVSFLCKCRPQKWSSKCSTKPTGHVALLWTMQSGFNFSNSVYKPMDFDIDIAGNDSEIFSSH